ESIMISIADSRPSPPFEGSIDPRSFASSSSSEDHTSGAMHVVTTSASAPVVDTTVSVDSVTQAQNVLCPSISSDNDVRRTASADDAGSAASAPANVLRNVGAIADVGEDAGAAAASRGLRGATPVPPTLLLAAHKPVPSALGASASLASAGMSPVAAASSTAGSAAASQTASVHSPPLPGADVTASGALLCAGSGASLPSLGLHVLFADDEASMRRVMLRMLQRIGCTGVTVDDGDGIIPALQASGQLPRAPDVPRGASPSSARPYDVIIVDFNMARMGGDEVCATLRHKYGVTLPMIAASGTSFERDPPAGFSASLLKPYETSKLAACLLEVTSSARGAHTYRR
ncbi:response regulator, partial [archaeon]